MIETNTLDAMISTPAACELSYTGCLGVATEHIAHPTGEALGEDWGMVWVCDGPCAWEAARDS